jgi:hypothetical protein
MMTRSLAAALALPVVLAGVAAAQNRAPVLVELFTSEACSSCPPADAVLARLERDQPITGVEVIALGEHVDYWNQTGWRDRFSSPLFSTRQQDYGQALRLTNIYTPQIVVNGREEAVGSDENAVRRAIRSAAQGPAAVVGLRMSGWDTASFQVRGLPQGVRSAEILLAITESGIESWISSGENNGRRLRHSPVVRSLTSLGKLDSQKDGAYSAEARINLRSQWNRQNLKLVLFVQDRANRRILGSAAARL